MKFINDFIRDCKEVYNGCFGKDDVAERIESMRSVEDAIREREEKKARKLDKKSYVLQQYSDVYVEKFYDMISINDEINKKLKKDTEKIRKMQYDGSDLYFVMWDNLIKRQDQTEMAIVISKMIPEANRYLSNLFLGLDDDVAYNKKLENLEHRIWYIDNKTDSMKGYFGFSFKQAEPADVPYLFAFVEKPVE